MSAAPSERFRTLLAADIHAAAIELLGAELVMGELRSLIVETESYSQDDPGCHAYRGKTKRTAIMFDSVGLAYVYFTYGNHWMLNITANPIGVPGAILIRAAKPISGLATMFERRVKARTDRDLLSGPGKLCQAYGINADHIGVDLLKPGSPLRIIPSESQVEPMIGTRIGLAPGKGDDLPWRFIHPDHLDYVSRPMPRRC